MINSNKTQSIKNVSATTSNRIGALIVGSTKEDVILEILILFVSNCKNGDDRFISFTANTSETWRNLD